MAIKSIAEMQSKLFSAFENAATAFENINYVDAKPAEKVELRKAAAETVKDLAHTILEVEREIVALDAIKAARDRGDVVVIEMGGASDKGSATMNTIRFKPKS